MGDPKASAEQAQRTILKIKPDCELCRATLADWQSSSAPWCETCERSGLVTVSLLLTKNKDVWRAKFLDCNQTLPIAPERRFQGTRGLFSMLAKTYDPGAVLDRLAYILHKTDTGSLQMRLTHEQYAKLCQGHRQKAEALSRL